MIEIEHKLYNAFQKASSEVFRLMRVVKGTTIKIPQLREEALSSTLCKILAEELKSDEIIKTLKMVPPKGTSVDAEPRSGMDIHIWLGNDDVKYIPFYIQAKSLKNKTKLDSKYKIDPEQLKKLISFSKGTDNVKKGLPLYFLYQHVNKTIQEGEHEVDFKESGVLVADAEFLNDLIAGGKKITINTLFAESKHHRENESENKIIPFIKLEDFSRYEPYYVSRIKDTLINFFFFFLFPLDPSGKKAFIHDINSNEIKALYSNEDSPYSSERKVLVLILNLNTKYRIRENMLNQILLSDD